MHGGLQGWLSNTLVLQKDVWSICTVLLIQMLHVHSTASFQCIKNAIEVYTFY